MALKHALLSGWPNPVAAAVTALTLGSEGATMTAANLKDGQPSNPARITSVFPHQSYIEVDFTVSTLVRALALVKHSLIPGGQVRVVGKESGALPAVRSQTLPPTAILASTNVIVGGIGSLDEHPSAPDNDPAIPIDEKDPWSIRLGFGTPALPPATGGDYQVFLVRVRQENQPTEPSDYPTATASLYEGGVLRRVLGTKLVTVPNLGTVAIFPWDASDLAVSDGSQVELLMEFEAGSDLTYAGMDSCSWEVLSAADLAAADLDTGWDVIAGAEPDPEWGSTALQRVDLPPALWHRFLDPAVSLKLLRVELRNDGLGFFADFQATPARTPTTYIDVGCLLAAPAFEAGYRFAPGGVLTIERKNVGESTALTGANRGATQWRRRRGEVNFPNLSEEQAGALLERLAWAAGIEHPGLISLEPGSSSRIGRMGTFWTQVAEAYALTYPEDGEVDGQRVRGIGFVFLEQL